MQTFTLILLIGMAATLLGCGLFDVGQKAAENEGEAAPLLVGTTQDRTAVPTRAENEGKAVSPSVGTSQGRTAATREESAGEVRPLSAITASVSYRGPTSLEERIFASQVVARVRLDSVSPTVEYGHTYLGMKHLVLLEFSFSVLEYLKGSGSSDIVAVWAAAPFFDTRQEAEAALPAVGAARDTRWDDREAVVFLQQDFRDFLPSTQHADRYYLAWGGSRPMYYWSDDGYSIASRHDRLWLPAEAAVGSPSQRSGDQQRFLMDSRTASTITLGEVKARIAEVTAKIDAGDGSEEYMECVRRTYLSYGVYRYRVETEDEEPFYRIPDRELDSGLAASSVVYEELDLGGLPDLRDKLWLDGGDADLFGVESGEAVPYDFSGDGVNDSIQYTQRVVSARPLPVGVYRFHFNHRDVHYVPCDGYTVRYEWTVTVTAPPNTLHEFFFDPVTVGSAVGADASNGVLKPTSFTSTDGTPANVESISYDSGRVRVKVVPWEALSGILDVIELDGTVSTSLRVTNSAVDVGSNTFTWSVPSQPWHDGDRLMVRIRRAEQ